MVQVMVLLALVVACLVTPEGAYAQAARVGGDSSQSALTAARQPMQHAVGIPDSVRRKVGYQHWKGAAIGGALGAVGGVVLALLVHAKCYDCTSDNPNVLEVGLMGAGLGGGFGLLVGAASPKYKWVPSVLQPQQLRPRRLDSREGT